MRAKRSKKYRKLMHQYELAFGFREPYQVLVDSNFLRAIHSFKMDFIQYLERTLQGKVKPLLTKCSLAATMASQPTNPKTNQPYRPDHLPPPTILPLRHCTHNEDDTPMDENDCLLSLFAPSPDAGKKNKEHYILATADPPAPEKLGAVADAKKRKRVENDAEKAVRKAKLLRDATRAIPGVPIVYVKRSVMVLEPMSAPSEGVRDGFELAKFRAGLDEGALGKRKRGEDEGGNAGGEGKNKKAGPEKKAKGPNPLSTKKPKKREGKVDVTAKKKKERVQGEKKQKDTAQDGEEERERKEEGDAPKPKRRRRHHHKGTQGDEEAPNGAEPSTTTAPDDANG